MSNIEKQYQGILRKLVLYGNEKETFQRINR